jgi:folate-binding protein YgfZ
MFSLDDYWTLRKKAAVVRRSDRAVLAVTGGDRATWLQGLLTNDVLTLQEGQSCYSAYLTPQGRMITDMHVIARADRLWLDVPAPLAASLRDRLDGLIFTEDAQVVDASESIVVWGVHGPDMVHRFKGSQVQGFGGSQVQRFEDEVQGFRFYLSAADPLPAALAELPQVSLETFDVLRIEAGVPKFLVDMTEDTIPLEAGIEDRAISFTKGCYVGQEVIVRVTHRGGGRVSKRLIQWRDSSHTVTAGAAIQSGDRAIGRVTSAAYSPAQDALIGLGYVHRDFVESGTAITVHGANESFDATIV